MAHYQEGHLLDINFFKPIMMFGLLVMNLFAVETAWQTTQYHLTGVSSSTPLAAVQNDITIQMEQYLEERKLVNVEAIIPAKIQVPNYPAEVEQPRHLKEVTLVRGEFDTKEVFAKRVEAEKERRERENILAIEKYERTVEARQERIIEINSDYREAIEGRNEKIVEIQAVLEADKKYLATRYKERLEKLPEVSAKFARKSFAKYFGNPRLSYKAYDVDARILQLYLHSEKNGFEELIELTIEPEEARKIKHHINTVEAQMIYDIEVDAEKQTFSITFARFEVFYDNRQYLARSAEFSRSYTPYSVKLATSGSNSLVSDLTPQMQPIGQDELVVPYYAKIEAERYEVINKSNDVLLRRLKKYEAKKVDAHKWLLVIGIEQYELSDNIIYAKRTAETFAKVAKKTLGIPQENIDVLLDRDATSGKISDALRALKRHVQRGDTIYFYYNGHGVPDPRHGNTPYILPSDRLPEYIVEDKKFALDTVYASLLETKASKVFVFVDTCFSGATDNQSVFKGTASARLVPRKTAVDVSRMSVMTAGKGVQFSNMYDEKQYRLMSYYLIDSLLDGEKDILTIYREVRKGVYSTSRKMGPVYIQEPQFFGNSKAEL